jgi:DNA-binding CsgD family transcriptional regulator
MKKKEERLKVTSLFSNLIKNNNNIWDIKDILDYLHAYILIFDTKLGLPIWANQYLENRLGYQVADVKNSIANKIKGSSQNKSIKKLTKLLLRDILNDSTDKNKLYPIKTSDNEWINVVFNLSPVSYASDGSINYVIGFGIELTKNELYKNFIKTNNRKNRNLNLPSNKKLSKRELEVTKYIVNCMTDKEIAEKLNISINTSKTHRKRIIGKLGLKNTASLVRYSLELGLV